MRNILIILALVLTCSWAFALEFQVCGALDLGNILYNEGLFGNDAIVVGTKYQPGLTVSLQSLANSNNILYGIGADYQFERKHEKFSEGWSTSLKYLTFLPLYAVLGYRFPVSEGPVPELFCQVGYNLALMEDSKLVSDYEINEYEFSGGKYYAFGAGMVFKHFVVQALFRNLSLNTDQTEINSWDGETKRSYDSKVQQLSIQIGKRF